MNRTGSTVAALAVLAFLAGSCGSDEGSSGQGSTTSVLSTADTGPTDSTAIDLTALVGEPTERYADPALWVCQGLTTDEVCTADLATTEIAADGTATVVERPPAEAPAVDCFYVYPTVDIAQEPGNATLDDTADMELMVRQQASQFSSVCRVFAPLYEQATIGSYDLESGDSDYLTTAPFETAYAQVLDAFRYYMANENDGRPIVLLGHSQGSHHLARLTAELFDGSPDLQDRLVVAALIGAGGFAVNAPPGEVVGGTFADIPLCTAADETGCVIVYSSYAAGAPETAAAFTGAPEGMQAACVNPAELLDGTPTVDASVFDYPSMGFGPIAVDTSDIGLGEVTTEFVTYPEAYSASCVTEDAGTGLAVGSADPTETRVPMPIDIELMESTGFGLHLFDFQLLAGDLLAMVTAQIEAAAS